MAELSPRARAHQRRALLQRLEKHLDVAAAKLLASVSRNAIAHHVQVARETLKRLDELEREG